MRILHQTYPYVLKHKDVASKSFHARMVCSMITMIMCLVVFCSATYAWFTDAQTSHVAPIQAAQYWQSVQSDTGAIVINEELSELTYTSPLVTDDIHTFTLTGGGTAQTGYAVVRIGDANYFTAPIAPNESMTLSIQAAQGSIISFSASWGEPTSSLLVISESADTTEVPFLCDGDLIEVSQTPYQIYMVEKLVTLEQVAAHYGVSVEDIVIYNGLETDMLPVSEEGNIDYSGIALTEGMELKIPNTEVTEPFTLPYSIYVLEKFVTLEEIAAYYGVSAEHILVYNGITELPEAGTALLIPNTDVTEPFVSAVTYALYTVEEDVTLEQLAEYYGVPVEDILYFNDITELTVGEEIKIPNTEVTEPFVLPEKETEVSTEKETIAETETGDTTETVSTEMENEETETTTETEAEYTTESESASTETSTSEEAGTESETESSESEVVEPSEQEEDTSDGTESFVETESLETETMASEIEAAAES